MMQPPLQDAFNARALNPDQVAATFVPSEHFPVLCNTAHSIVLGPRGSGKTTLLKMLQPAALSTWQHERAAPLRARLGFTGVFIATDISWGEQLSALGQRGLPDALRETLGAATFTTHVLRSFIISLQQRIVDRATTPEPIFRPITLSLAQEAHAIKALATAWHLSATVPSLASLKQALSDRLLKIRQIANEAAYCHRAGQPQPPLPDFVHLHYLSTLGYALDVLEGNVTEPGEKWALLFDELELAPEFIQAELVQSIRSSDERLLYKLALNPLARSLEIVKMATSPSPGQDFDQISLWYAEKRDAYAFCSALWNVVASGLPEGRRSAREVLGPSFFSGDAEEDSDGDAYGIGSKWEKIFRSLSEKDVSFRTYLFEKGISPQALHAVDGVKRASELRKMAPIVAVREYFRKPDTSTQKDIPRSTVRGRRRSRKTATIYAGAEAFFAITEGNPRWFIAIAKRLIARIDPATGMVSPSIQFREFQAAAERFGATVRTLPFEHEPDHRGPTISGLLSRIGQFFHQEAVLGAFKPEAHGSFYVDDTATDELVGMLQQALNSGAIVYLPESERDIILTSVRGKRFRLAYLLAALYKFPIRLGKPVSLARILNSQPLHSNQLSLEAHDD